MGCGGSSAKRDLELQERLKTSWQAQFRALKLSAREITKLYKVFCEIAMSEDAKRLKLSDLVSFIEVGSLQAYSHIPQETQFPGRIFGIFDIHNTGHINFRDFVLQVWNYCTLGKQTLEIFTFDLYDTSEKGYLDSQDIRNMMSDAYGSSLYGNDGNKFAKAAETELLKIHKAHSGVDVAKFIDFTRTHHTLLYPAYQIQRILMKKIMGQSFWSKQANKRIEISKGKYVPIVKFMEIHLNKELYEEFIHDTKIRPEAEYLAEHTGTRHERKLVHDKEKEQRKIAKTNKTDDVRHAASV